MGDDFVVTLHAGLPAQMGKAEPEPTGKGRHAAPDFPGNERQEEIVRIATGKGWVTSGEVVKKLGIVKDTAVRDLNDLIDMGLLRKEGTGRGTRYFPTGEGKRFSSDSRPNIGLKSDDK
ncbi:MAG: DeoR-like helix-turn-helix domain [Verrucomicrobiota bacterium]|jgi:predicted HTH transcriptional regulator